MNVSQELNSIISTLTRMVGNISGYYPSMNINQKIHLIYQLSNRLSLRTQTNIMPANLNDQLDKAIFNMSLIAGSIGSSHSLSLSPKIHFAYRLSQRLNFVPTTTSTSTTSTTTTSGDIDANNWLAQLAANGATQDSTHQGYIQTFIQGLKTDSLWAGIPAIYVPIFGSANANKWNIKNSVDSDASFRLTFTGSWTYGSNGSTPDASTAFADTHINISTNVGQNTLGMGVYIRAAGSGTHPFIMGCYNGGTNLNDCKTGTGLFGGSINSSADTVPSVVTPHRLGIVQRISSTNEKIYMDGTLLQNVSSTSTAPANLTIYVGAVNSSGTAAFFSDIPVSIYLVTNQAFADSDITNLTNRINTFLTSWGINV